MVERLIRFFKLGLYTRDQLHRFVDKGVISEEQYQAIVGETA